MYRIKLCMGLCDEFGVPYEEQIRMLRRVGFDGFFVKWPADIASLRRVADEEGMLFQSIHGPWHKIIDLWYPMERSEEAVAELIACAQDCADNQVPIMVLHACQGFDMTEPTDFGLRQFGRVIEAAKALGVKVAFENLQGIQFVDALLAHYRDDPWVGFCWDSGHEQCYYPGEDLLSRYGAKLMATHLNDNLGVRDFSGRISGLDDLHLLPFDGIADWQDVAARLRRWGFRECLTFELKLASKPGRRENDFYAHMSLEEYLTLAYMRACRVGAMVLRD